MRLLVSRRSWPSLNLLLKHFLLACVLVLFSCSAASGQVRFIQITDPHFYDEKDATANKRAFVECIAKINKLIDEGGDYKFIVVTGDIGLEKLVKLLLDQRRELEKLPDSADKRDQIDTLDRTITLRVTDSASEVANMIGQSRMKVWLFLPGNNDLLDERIWLDGKENNSAPGQEIDGLTYYRDFVEQLGEKLSGKKIIDLCPTEDPNKGAYTDIEGLVFVGFNNASFKNNNDAKRISADITKTASVVARTDSQRCEAAPGAGKIQTGAGLIPTAELPKTKETEAQLKYVQQVIDRIDKYKSQYAYVLYHIPDADDPYAVQDSGSASLVNRSLTQSDQYFFSSWFVDGCVRERWAKVVTNPKVRGLFAGHFHDWRRETYQDYRWNITPNYVGGSLSKQYVSPPLAVKRQDVQPSQARGFQAVSIDGTGKVSVNIFWYDAASGTFESADEKQSAAASVSSRRVLGSAVSYVWGTIPSYLPFYLIVIVCGYAVIRGWKRATVIAPFRMPSGNQIPFGEDTVANFLRDAFVEIRKRADDGIDDHRADSAVREALGLRDFRLSAPSNFEVPIKFAVEVKGMSHEALVSFARKVLGRERIISGDVIGDEKSFSLLARCGGDHWTCSSSVATTEGLKKACFRLAFSVLGTSDPSVLIAYTTVKAAEVAKDMSKESLESLVEAVERLPDDVQVESFNNLASALAREGKYDEAIANYEKALAVRRDHAGVLYNLGNALLENEQPEKAIERYREALAVTPRDPDILFNLGYVLDKKEEYDEAIQKYREALSIKPDDPAILYNLGLALSKIEQTKEALEYVRRAQKLRPEDSEITELVNALQDLDS